MPTVSFVTVEKIHGHFHPILLSMVLMDILRRNAVSLRTNEKILTLSYADSERFTRTLLTEKLHLENFND